MSDPIDPLEETSERLRALHEAAGVPPPDSVAKSGPCVYVGEERAARPDVATLVSDLTKAVRSRGLYLRNNDIGTVDERTGEFEIMTAYSLVTWIPSAGVTLVKKKIVDNRTGQEKIISGDIGVELARVFLASKELRAKLPEIAHINRVPLPVYREEKDERGFRKIELLQPGYDAPTRTFTCHNSTEIDEKTDVHKLTAWLFQILKTFDWSGKNPTTGHSDRMAVHVAAMLSVFCRSLYSGKAPAFLYKSNLEGSGKSSLVKMALLPVFRRVGTTTIDPMDKAELVKGLNTTASSGSEYLLGDEMPAGSQLRDQNLARWVTEDTWEFRSMGQDKMKSKIDIEKIVSIFAGNRITVDRNLDRRILLVDFFMHQTSREKTLPPDAVLLEREWFLDDANLSKLLSLCWAIVRAWDENGRPATKDRLLESFEGWSRIVPGMVEDVGFGRPLAPFEEAGSGDDESRDMKRLAVALFDDHLKRDGEWLNEKLVTMRDVVRCARLNRIFEDKLGNLDDVFRELKNKKSFTWDKVPDGATVDAFGEEIPPGDQRYRDPDEEERRLQAAAYIDERIGSTFGKYFKKHAAIDGRYFTASNGALYAFGDRGSSKGSRYLLRRVTP